MTPVVKLNSTEAILMLDDSQEDLIIAEQCLQMSGLSNPFLAFTRASELMAYFDGVRDGTNPMPALLLLDLNMPDMSGFDVLQALRADECFKDVPVILALTNSDRISDRERVLSLQADGFHTKDGDIKAYVRFFQSLAA